MLHYNNASKTKKRYLVVAELCQPEEHSLPDRLHRVVHVELGPVVPEDGAGEDVEADVAQV